MMQKFKRRTIYIVAVMWFIVLCHSIYTRIVRNVFMGQATPAQFIFFFLFMMVIICFLLFSLILVKRKEKLSWKAVLKVQIDILDEDERSLNIDLKQRRTTASIILCSAIVIFFVLETGFGMWSIRTADGLLLIALVVTAYYFITYMSIKKVYDNDEPSIFVRYPALSAICIAGLILGVFGLQQTLMSTLNRKPVQVVTIIGYSQTEETLVSIGPVVGYIDSKTGSILVNGNDVKTLLRVIRLDSDYLLVFDGSIEDYNEARFSHIFDKNQDPDTFYQTLTPVRVAFLDFDTALAVLVEE